MRAAPPTPATIVTTSTPISIPFTSRPSYADHQRNAHLRAHLTAPDTQAVVNLPPTAPRPFSVRRIPNPASAPCPMLDFGLYLCYTI